LPPSFRSAFRYFGHAFEGGRRRISPAIRDTFSGVYSYLSDTELATVGDKVFNMSVIEHPEFGPNIYRDDQDGYETGNLLHFHFGDREMVAIVRDRSQFEAHRKSPPHCKTL